MFNVIFQFGSTIIPHYVYTLIFQERPDEVEIHIFETKERKHELKRTKHSQSLPCFIEYGKNMVFPFSVVCKSKTNMFVGTNRLYWNIVHK